MAPLTATRVNVVVGVGVFFVVAIWVRSLLMKSQATCGDSGAEAVLVSNYRRHLEEMQESIKALRQEKNAGGGTESDAAQVKLLQDQLTTMRSQLVEVETLKRRNQELEQQLKLNSASVPHRMQPTLDRMPLPSDAKDWSKVKKHAPTFEELYQQLYNQAYDPKDNVIQGFPNPYNKVAHMNYPHSSVWLEGDKIIDRLMKELAPDVPRFIVEAGSMHGGSAIRMAMELDKRGLKEVPILCIDPWTGDLNMWLNRIVWEHLDVRHGRATTFDQFVLNVREAIRTGKITDRHINPFPVSSVIGARWLQATGFLPNIIYLDSAHEVDETYYELCLYWHILEPGGILMGDDYGWLAVRVDVDRFVKDYGLKLEMFGVYYNWFIKKPKAGSNFLTR